MMKRILLAVLLTCILSSCAVVDKVYLIFNTPTPDWTPTPIPTATPLPDPQIHVTEVPQATGAAQAFLEAWKNEDYLRMYSMLSQVSRDSVDADVFTKRYKDTSIALTLRDLTYEVTSSLTSPDSAQVAYRTTFDTALAGTISREMNMEMVYEGGDWKIQWEDGMIMPELRDGNKLVMDIQVPTRGTIYDRDGVALAYATRAYSLGVVPSQVPAGYWSGLISEFSRLTGKTPQVVTDLMNSAEMGEYVIIGEVPAETMEARYSNVAEYTGVSVSSYESPRYYTEGGIGTHIVGYVQPIGEDEAESMQRAGYRIDERVGRLGIERWGQDSLSGTRGASLYVVDPEGNTVDRISRTDPLAADSIYTTFNEDFQYDLQRSIAGLNAAVVVLERDTGRVLGLASSPDFDANLLDYGNYNSYFAGNELYNENRPMYNRATQGQYPLGSVFKIIGMAAALETGIYEIEDTYECGYDFTELDGVTLHDWTLDHEVAPSGTLNLSEALMRSCNPWFYKIGLELYRQTGADTLPEYARGFGLGSLTGIGELEEEPGNVETPSDEYTSVQLGIGQSTLLVTPLQVARFIAAIGNGGTLYRPQVVEQIVDPLGHVKYNFEPEAQGQLPITDDTLEKLREAMETVVRNPRGTAYSVFNQIRYKLYGKTGSASTAPGMNSHAWFAAYTDENRADKPDIAIAVVAEYAGEGSEVAAPITRRVLELYFEGRATFLYSWESGIYITKTATPTVTNTPTPKPTRAPWEVDTEEQAEGQQNDNNVGQEVPLGVAVD